MTPTPIHARKVAKLANLFITEEEESLLNMQLGSTITHVESLNNINTDHITGTNTVTNLTNILRDDVITPSLSQEDALRNAKSTYNGFFMVPIILEEAVE